MIKTFAITSTLTAMYSSPVIALLTLVALVFFADLLNRYLESKKISYISIDWDAYSYRDIQLLAKANGIKANSKRELLINSLQTI